MKVLVASDSDTFTEYLKNTAHEVRIIYVNNLAIQEAMEFACNAVVYFSNVQVVIPHERVLKSLHEDGFKVVLVVEPGNPIIVYAQKIGISEILTLPVQPEEILCSLEKNHEKDNSQKPEEVCIMPEPIPLVSDIVNKENQTAKRAEAFSEENDRTTKTEINEYGGKKNASEQSEIYRDVLTGCYTRRFLSERLNLTGLYSVVFIDLDSFKPVNDILGHNAGDRVLAAFGEMLNENIKGRDLALRWGGDEFILVLPETTQNDAEKVVENLQKIWEKVVPDTGNLRVGFSAGVSTGNSPEELLGVIKVADKAMYEAKNKNKIKVPKVPLIETEYSKQATASTQSLGDNLSRKEIFVQTVYGVFYVLGIMVLISAGIWIASFSLNILGKNSPTLDKTAKNIVEFWKVVMTGLFG